MRLHPAGNHGDAHVAGGRARALLGNAYA